MSRVRMFEKDTMATFIRAVADKYGDLTAISKYADPHSAITYGSLPRYARAIGGFLLEKGLAPGDKVMILGDSCPHWALSWFGVACSGFTAVPILPAFAKPDIEKIVRHSGARFVFASGANLEKVQGLGIGIVRMDDMVFTDGRENCCVLDYVPSAQSCERLDNLNMDSSDVVSIIYTSGTTGEPKGVMLTHRNLLWNADACADPFIHIHRGWRVLSILPLAHVYEFTLGLLLTLLAGCHITYFARPIAVTPLMKAFREVKPHIVLSVPLLIEKVYSKAIVPQIKGNERIARLMKMPVIGTFVYRMIGRKLIHTFGGSLRFFGVGGAPLDLEVEKFLHRAGFPYALGYGMTETSPYIAGCGPSFQSPGTLGPVLKGVEVRLDPDTGEVQTRSPSVMKGYYKNPQLTAQVLSPDGWMSTGDIGRFEGRRLAICGRIKEMILTAAGENIFPEAIESLINRMDFVEESLIIPENGGLLALIKLDMDAFGKRFASQLGEEKERALAYIQELRETINRQLPATSIINRAEIQETPFERTPTSKIKRLAVIRSRMQGNHQGL